MTVLRWIFAIVGGIAVLAAVLMAADPNVRRLWNEMPPRMVIPQPIMPGSELSILMADARKASRADDHKRAAELHTRALAIEPGPNVISQDLLASRGSEYNHLDMSEKAFVDYDAAIRIGYYGKPLSTAAIRSHMGRGYAAINLRQHQRAKDDFDVVLKDLPMPRSSATLAWRGAAWQGLGERAHAIADYKGALALDPSNGYAQNALKDLGAP